MSNVSLLDIEKIKREAKKNRKHFPSLSHGQRLDQAAIAILKVRDFHEAKELSSKHINSFVYKSGATDNCKYCHLTFVSTEKHDIKEHEKMHLEYEKVESSLGFIPSGMEAREKEKRLAYEELALKNSDKIQINGALRLMKSWFERSLEASISRGDWSNHPSFKKYVSMLDFSDLFSKKIMKTIHERYGKIDGKISKGTTYWVM